LTSDEKVRIIELYQNDAPLAEIKREVTATAGSINRIVRDAGLPTRWSRLPMRHDAFRSLDDPRAAYFLGLLMADGSINEGSRRVALGLRRRDRAVLERFCDFLETTRERVYDYTKDGRLTSMVVFTSAELTADVMRYGVVPLKGRGNPCVADELINNHNFWKGLIDGDGSLFYAVDRRRTNPAPNKTHPGTPGISLRGRRSLLEQFVAYVERTVGLPQARVISTDSTGCSDIAFTGEIARAIIHNLYGDEEVVALEAKAELAQEMLTWQTRTERGTAMLTCAYCGNSFRRKNSQAPAELAFCCHEHNAIYRHEHREYEDHNSEVKAQYAAARALWAAPNTPSNARFIENYEPCLREYGLTNIHTRRDLSSHGTIFEADDADGPLVIWCVSDVKVSQLRKLERVRAEGKRAAVLHYSTLTPGRYHINYLSSTAKGSRLTVDMLRSSRVTALAAAPD
jgi:hypothetical protein